MKKEINKLKKIVKGDSTIGKICPLTEKECVRAKCELWLSSVTTTENITAPGRCSIRFLAEKNSEGLLVV